MKCVIAVDGEEMETKLLTKLILYAVALGMGVVSVVTATLGTIEIKTVATLLGIGMFCLGLAGLDSISNKEKK